MKWYIYIIMVGMYSDGTKDTYVYTEPTLPTLEACQEYVYKNSHHLRMNMMKEFDGKQIQQVFCIEEEKLKNRPENWRLACQTLIKSSAVILTKPQSPPSNLEELKKISENKKLPR